ncbi:MAG: aminodeoxychorismate/anthranilate synthase component II [Ignavibacteriae bacterium]|nr:MAG: aminodeoxychorismate/anthranilate synthase component II [Ignavibacteriota bacterium]
MILVIDNYDSFTYNLVQAIGKKTEEILVKRNDELTTDEISRLAPRGIILSPGPGKPEHAGITVEVIRQFGASIPILGVCLGHQAIGFAFGATITHAPTLMHGRTSPVSHTGETILKTVRNPLNVGRYHSLVISGDRFPEDLTISARTQDGIIMGVRHRKFPIEGIQFHPESVLTQDGEIILNNWLEVYKIL